MPPTTPCPSRSRCLLLAGLAAAALAGCDGTPPATDDGGPDDPDATDLDARAIDADIDADIPVETALATELGHVNHVISIQRSATRILTIDDTSHWALWDPSTRALVAKGDRVCPPTFACGLPAASLAGNVVVVRTHPDLEVRSAITGQVTATIPMGSPLDVPHTGVATDGSYVWAATGTSLRAWSPAGVLRATAAGNYLLAKVFAAPLELRVGGGPAGPGTLELVRAADGQRTTVAHAGGFWAWFVDGERFLTTTGELVRVYSAAGALASAAILPVRTDLTGQGDRVWVRDTAGLGDHLRIYAAADLAAAPQEVAITDAATLVPSADTLGVIDGGAARVDIVTLGATVTTTHAITPFDHLESYAGTSASWLAGNRDGAVVTGAGVAAGPILARGKLLSVSGTVGGQAALATAAGTVEVLRVGAAPLVIRTLPYLASHVELSTDGATLIATGYLDSGPYREDLTLRAITTATGVVRHAWPYAWSSPDMFFEVGVARTGLRLCHVLGSTSGDWTSRRTLTTVDGVALPDYGPPLTSDLLGVRGPHLFSPDGSRAAITSGYPTLDQAFTFLYQDGTQRAIVDGIALGWLADDQVLIARYARVGGNPTLAATTIVRPDGTVVATVALPDLRPVELLATRVRGNVTPAGGGQLYARRQNAVYDQTTGARVWQGQPGGVGGDVAGDYVVYTLGTQIQVARFRP